MQTARCSLLGGSGGALAALLSIVSLLSITAASFAAEPSRGKKQVNRDASAESAPDKTAGASTELATFGAGCFWCVEALFQQLEGVQKVTSGYSGGFVENPTYKQVCTGATGHAEVIQVEYDPAKISFDELLEVFWKTHDPTTLNQQGPDVGTPEQKALAEKYKQKLNAEGAFANPIVTEITEFTNFYPAEDYHQNYYRENKSQGYCRVVIKPKLDKFRIVFKEKLKTTADKKSKTDE
jgi:peptide-methionine (S)-S-oxide reductase